MRNANLSPRSRAVMSFDGGSMFETYTIPWRLSAAVLALVLSFGSVACDPDADGTPTANDCAPNNQGGGQIDECDCPENPVTPERCFEADPAPPETEEVEDDSPPAVEDTSSPDDEPEDADGDGVDEDQDCDDFDPAVGAATAWYYDDDEDGYGLDEDIIVACEQPAHYVSEGGDCDDLDASVNPDADEACNGVDQDCDGLSDADEGLTETFYADDDQDGFGDLDEFEEACDIDDLDGFVGNSDDCDDGNAANSPAGEEVCDDVDNDCDNVVDEDEAIDATTWYTDADGDGHGDPSGPTDVDCNQPEGFAADLDDCDDGDDAVYLDAVEIDCDDVDNDCDGEVQESEDCDGDGVTSDIDCEDADGGNSPLFNEDCEDGADNDCDMLVDLADEDCSDESDDDLDGQTEADGDCDDLDATVYDGADEVEDGVDNDCDGVIDEGTEGYDDDGDGVSDTDGDCDDGDATVAPDLAETCDDYVDNDCNGTVDDGCAYIDADGDGYTPIVDCDDADSSINPGAEDVVDDAIDQDCDGEDAASESEPDDTGDTVDTSGDTGEPADSGGVDTGGDIDDTGLADTGDTGADDVDADRDNIDDTVDLMIVADSGETEFCFADEVFDAIYQSLDAFAVGDQIEMGAWLELLDAMRISPENGEYCVDFSSLDTGTYRFTIVSAGSVSDPTTEVDQSDQSDWYWADYDGGFCDSYAEAYCYPNRYDDSDVEGDGAEDDIDSYSVRLIWDGTDIVPAPESYNP